MSALDKTVADLDAKRSKDGAERRARQQASTAFLQEFSRPIWRHQGA